MNGYQRAKLPRGWPVALKSRGGAIVSLTSNFLTKSAMKSDEHASEVCGNVLSAFRHIADTFTGSRYGCNGREGGRGNNLNLSIVS